MRIKAAARSLIIIAIVVATLTAFAYYFARHPAVGHQLGQISFLTLAIIFLLYLGVLAALAMITLTTIRLCNVELAASESLLLSAYSSIVNFFGPLQSGPAFRAVYLKKKHGLNLKQYAVATMVYYCFFGAMSGIFLLSHVLAWWLLPLSVVGIGVVYGFSRTKRIRPRLRALDLRGWYYLALATFTQIAITALIYYTELRSVVPGVHFWQAIVYTGAANLALFVSLTPGAIGFRESFLIFSRQLHHIGNSAIVAANIIDRGMYVIVLLVLAVFIFGTHAKRRLTMVTKPPTRL